MFMWLSVVYIIQSTFVVFWMLVYGALSQLQRRTKRNTSPGVVGPSYSMLLNLRFMAKMFFVKLVYNVYKSTYVPKQWLKISIILITTVGFNISSASDKLSPIFLLSCVCNRVQKNSFTYDALVILVTIIQIFFLNIPENNMFSRLDVLIRFLMISSYKKLSIHQTTLKRENYLATIFITF